MPSSPVDAYLEALPPDRRALLDRVRLLVHEAAPGAVDAISYGMPGVRLGGRLLVSYAAFARHWSLFPASGAVMAAMGEALAPYFKPTATLRFAWTEPVPADLVRRFVAVRVAEITPPG